MELHNHEWSEFVFHHKFSMQSRSTTTEINLTQFLYERESITILFPFPRMIDKSEKGIINWRVASVVLLIIFVMNLVCSIIYADSPFLIESYFPDVRR